MGRCSHAVSLFSQTSVDQLNRSREQDLKGSIDSMIGLALEGNHLCR